MCQSPVPDAGENSEHQVPGSLQHPLLLIFIYLNMYRRPGMDPHLETIRLITKTNPSPSWYLQSNGETNSEGNLICKLKKKNIKK